MNLKFFKIVPLLIVFVCGCSTANHIPNDISVDAPITTPLSLESNICFLCSHDYENGIELYDSNGELIFELENARVDFCTTDSGVLIEPTAGQIPNSSYLFISQMNGEKTYSGVWDVINQDWKLPLQRGTGDVTSIENVFRWYSIGSEEEILRYNFQFERIDELTLSTTFPFSANDRYYRTSVYDHGLSYIADETGHCVLDGVTFWERNQHLGILEAFPYNSVELRYIYDDKYMFLYFEQENPPYSEPVSYSFVCDLEGHILCSDYKHNSVTNPIDQYMGDESHVFLLHDLENGSSFYIDNYTGEKYMLPDNDWRFMNETYFIDDRGYDGILIYDAKTQSTGATFFDDIDNSLTGADEIFVFGLNSYAITTDYHGLIVLDGQPQNLPPDTEKILVKDGPYTIISYGSKENPYDYSYVVDSEGHLVLETEETVVYADAQYYITIMEDASYKINCFEGSVTENHPILTDSKIRFDEIPAPLLNISENAIDN